MNRYHCALDLELEQPNTRSDTKDSHLDEEKIIQVGYVIYKLEPEFEIVEEVSRFVNIGVPLSEFIQKLTGISNEDIESGDTIENIYNELVKLQQKYKFSRVVKQWGSGDMECLKKELPSVKWEFGRSGCNVKHLYQLYGEAAGLGVSGGLKKSLHKCKLKWQGGKAHDALEDARNTAYFHNFFYQLFKKTLD